MHEHTSHEQTDIEFPSATEGLPEARRPEVVELSDGDEFDLEIAPSGSRSETPSCECSPTTAPSRARP